MIRSRTVPLGALLLVGCLTQRQPRPHDHHLQIHWLTDFAQAQTQAAIGHEPILLCLVAGELNGPC